MPSISIGATVLRILSRSLAPYVHDLGEVIEAIKQEASRADQPAESYIPKAYLSDYETVQKAVGTTNWILSTGHAGLFPQEIPTDILGAMHSSLILFRSDLEDRLWIVQADPLSPRDAASPLRDRIDWIDKETDRFWSRYPVLDTLRLVQERRILKKGLSHPRDVSVDAALATGEGQEVEFMEAYPKQTHDLAKEIAAFGTTNPGVIFLGITDDGHIKGLESVDTMEAKDKLRSRIEGLCSNSVIPALLAKIEFEIYNDKQLAIVGVPKGPAPVYYSNNIPYIRHVARSRPAQHQEVVELVRRYLERQK